MLPAKYNFVIQNTDGLYYRGSAHGNTKDWTDNILESFNGAFGYTEDGAYNAMERFPTFFAGCKVVDRKNAITFKLI